jgi:protoporphyrinogen/coproporphyrinogen III oxidase
MSSTIPHVQVAIVGGGITGLSAAWYLQQKASEANQSLTYTLLEAGDRWGGKVKTEIVNDLGTEKPFVIEAGPDSFITQKPWAWQLARQLGLNEQLLPTNDEKRQTFILNKGEPVTMPEGLMLIVPTSITPFLKSRLLSWRGKLRMGLDLFVPPRRDGQDESLGDFVRRRLGEEALNKLAEPLLSGIYNADVEEQSLLATFPRFRDLEVKHGSLIRGMLAAKQMRQQAAANRQGENGRSRPTPPSFFTSMRDGMASLTDELRTRLTGDCHLDTTVTELVREENGRYRLTLNDSEQITADSVILAIPAYAAADLLDELAPDAAGDLRAIRYVSTGTLSLAYRAEDVDHPLDGFGLVIPRHEARSLNAITWTSTKFNHRAPAGYVLLRVFFGGTRSPHMPELADETILTLARTELTDLMGIKATPLFHRLYRWFSATPQYDVGHLDRVAVIEATLPAGLFVSGSPYRGIGLPDCVRQAQEVAEKVWNVVRSA